MKRTPALILLISLLSWGQQPANPPAAQAMPAANAVEQLRVGAAPSPNIPYLAKPAFGPLVITNNTSRNLRGGFEAAVRADLNADAGGVYAGSQSAYSALLANTVMKTKGQAIGYFCYSKGLGVGNAICGNGVVEGWGGSGDVAPGSLPAIEAVGEFEAFQGSALPGHSIFRAALAGSPAAGATALQYARPVNEDVLGQRYLLNRDHVTTAGRVLSTSGRQVQFSGTAWTKLNPSPVGQYLKIGSSNDLYAPPCAGDDVEFDGLCVGHWYKIKAVDSDVQLTLEAPYDKVGLTTAFPAPYVLMQGSEVQSFDTAAHRVTIGDNQYAWRAGDTIYSPPNHILLMLGLNVILHKTFRTGSGTGASDGLRLINLGPALMDRAIWITGQTGTRKGGFRNGVVFNDFNGSGVALDMHNTDVGAALWIAKSNGENNKIKFGGAGDGQLSYDGSRLTLAAPAGVKTGGPLTVNDGTAITAIKIYAATLTPSRVDAHTCAEQTFPVAGLTMSDRVLVNGPAPTAGTGMGGVRVSAAATLAINFCNPTAGPLVPAAGVYSVLAVRD